mmetsp:Transcript_54829/g.119627  ORF Transcript_54829/g.119627 Transcript_54829/m.119627 type:complete len:265 (+) Transcript_54829:1245-2039(+)
MNETTFAVSLWSSAAWRWWRSMARHWPRVFKRMCWSSAIDDVRPVSASCLCLSTRLRASPRPSSRKEVGPVSTPTSVLFPASTLPTTATRKSRCRPSDGSLRTSTNLVNVDGLASLAPSRPSLASLPSCSAPVLASTPPPSRAPSAPPSLRTACTTVQSQPHVAASCSSLPVNSSTSASLAGPSVTRLSPSLSAAYCSRVSHGSSAPAEVSEKRSTGVFSNAASSAAGGALGFFSGVIRDAFARVSPASAPCASSNSVMVSAIL